MLCQTQRALLTCATAAVHTAPRQRSHSCGVLLSSSSSSSLRSCLVPAAPLSGPAASRLPLPWRRPPSSCRGPVLQPARAFVSQAVVVTGVLVVGYLLRSKWREIRAMRPDLQSEPLDPQAAAAAGARFHDGGFNDKMDRREAALILGVREGASRERVMLRYRQLMKVNHPDLGGSPYVSTKINEAKELLSRTARTEHQPAAPDRGRDRDRDRDRDRAGER